MLHSALTLYAFFGSSQEIGSEEECFQNDIFWDVKPQLNRSTLFTYGCGRMCVLVCASKLIGTYTNVHWFTGCFAYALRLAIFPFTWREVDA